MRHLQVQDASLQTVGKVLDRMAELRTMAVDITKNSQDIENYTKEFMELQMHFNQVHKEIFNGISLFSRTDSVAVIGELEGQSTYLDASVQRHHSTFARELITHPMPQHPEASR